MSARRGFTLIELMISVTIMLLGVALAGALMVTGTRIAHQADMRAFEADADRTAMGEVVKALRSAGNGAPAGVYVSVAGTPTLLSPVFGLDGTSGNGSSAPAPVTPETDDLWLIVADDNAGRESCVDHGAAATVTAAGLGDIAVTCTGGFAAGDTLLVSNMNTAALLDHVSFAGTTITGYDEHGSGISDAPDKGGFQVGDMAYGAQVVHYFVRNDANGAPGLYRSTGALTGLAPTGTYPNGPYPQEGRPFMDSSAGVLVQPYIEDFQVAYGLDTAGSGDPTTFTWVNGLAPTSPGGGVPPLRAIRLTVVARSQLVLRNDQSATVLTSSTTPPTIENHLSSGVADGYERLPFTRTLELPNLNPGSM